MEEDREGLLVYLPPDVLFLIFSFCDAETLGRLSQVCRRFNSIVSHDCLWNSRSKYMLATNQRSEAIISRSCILLSAREKCRISHNWRKAVYREDCLVKHRTKYLPWLQLKSRNLWFSKGNVILCHQRFANGHIKHHPRYILRGHVDDVCRFVCKQGLIVSGGRDGSLCGWLEDTGRFLFYKKHCHSGDVNCVDTRQNIILTGSKDKTIQIWNLNHNFNVQPVARINTSDRVWSVTIGPDGNNFCCGTAGYHGIPPLRLYDLNVGTFLCNIGNNFRNGAGILDIIYESPFTILSAGYDTYIRRWDIRTKHCVCEWEDPYDCAIYCLATDNSYSILSGTARHGVVRLWDLRSTKCVQMYYVGGGNSPVYCVNFDPCYMYTALDVGIYLVNFTTYRSVGATF